ncbi:MAG: DMT family transporter [Dehalobacterium sp.]
MEQGNLKKYLPYGQIVFACMVWGSYGLFVQGVDQPPQVIVFFRFLFGFFSLLFVMGYTKQLGKLIIPDGRKFLVLAGIINSISWLLITNSIQMTSVANGFILYYTAPCFVVLLAPMLLKEKVKKKSWVALMLCFVGIINVVGSGEWNLATLNWQGNLLGLGSGIFYAFYILLLKKLPSHLLGLISNTYVCAVISLITFPMSLPSLGNITFPDLLILALAGITIQGIATSFYMVGLRKVSAQHASILCYLEVLFASLFAVVFLKENFTIHLFIGGLLVISGGMLVIFNSNSKKIKGWRAEI